MLHGLFCAPDTAQCQLAERVGLFMRQLQEAGCPEVVTVQEANAATVALIEPLLDACGYGLVWDGDPGMDRELVLTVVTAVDSRRIPLAGGVRSAYIVRLDSELGGVDLVSAHLASARDNRACDPATCPPPCDAADELRACQVRQVLQAVGELASSDIVALAGDFNAMPGDPAYQLVVDAGFVDSHLAAGREECTADTPASCTVGRDDSSMTDLTDPASRQDARIDYVFIAPLPPRCAIGGATGPFNAEPAQGPIAYPSDHTAVMSTLTCSPSEGHSATTFPPASV
ncbi:MAG TPA: endonuclease/exonuclease/phosphatase family protein [Ilumatobacter sp.]|nr:endonuclease/exonuclease/phosphatase family protein [Ilumatobacter sp.]